MTGASGNTSSDTAAKKKLLGNRSKSCSSLSSTTLTGSLTNKDSEDLKNSSSSSTDSSPARLSSNSESSSPKSCNSLSSASAVTAETETVSRAPRSAPSSPRTTPNTRISSVGQDNPKELLLGPAAVLSSDSKESQLSSVDLQKNNDEELISFKKFVKEFMSGVIKGQDQKNIVNLDDKILQEILHITIAAAEKLLKTKLPSIDLERIIDLSLGHVIRHTATFLSFFENDKKNNSKVIMHYLKTQFAIAQYIVSVMSSKQKKAGNQSFSEEEKELRNRLNQYQSDQFIHVHSAELTPEQRVAVDGGTAIVFPICSANFVDESKDKASSQYMDDQCSSKKDLREMTEYYIGCGVKKVRYHIASDDTEIELPPTLEQFKEFREGRLQDQVGSLVKLCEEIKKDYESKSSDAHVNVYLDSKKLFDEKEMPSQDKKNTITLEVTTDPFWEKQKSFLQAHQIIQDMLFKVKSNMQGQSRLKIADDVRQFVKRKFKSKLLELFKTHRLSLQDLKEYVLKKKTPTNHHLKDEKVEGLQQPCSSANIIQSINNAANGATFSRAQNGSTHLPAKKEETLVEILIEKALEQAAIIGGTQEDDPTKQAQLKGLAFFTMSAVSMQQMGGGRNNKDGMSADANHRAGLAV